MKLSKDQKKLAKNLTIFAICYVVYTILYHTIKGDANWNDILWMSLGLIAANILVGLFYIIGSKTPSDKAES